MEFKIDFVMKRCSDCVKIQPINKADMVLFDRLIAKNESVYKGTFGTPVHARTYRQIRTIWKLIEIIFISQEGRKPTEEERYELYEDLLDEYAEKRVSKISGNLVPVRVSKSDTKAGAYFIEGLMLHLSQYCDLPMDAQTEVRALLFEYEYYKGMHGDEYVNQCSENEYRQQHPYSEASGKGGALHLHHLIPKGRNECLRHITANWIQLTAEEHHDLHLKGDEWFLKQFPHLRPKFEYAKELEKRTYEGGYGNRK